MFGRLVNTFLGERMFSVILKLSRHFEEKSYIVSKDQELEDLISIWKGKAHAAEFPRSHIRLEDYIIYIDMLYNGSQDDKNMISFFMMSDSQGQNQVFYEDYRSFCL